MQATHADEKHVPRRVRRIHSPTRKRGMLEDKRDYRHNEPVSIQWIERNPGENMVTKKEKAQESERSGSGGRGEPHTGGGRDQQGGGKKASSGGRTKGGGQPGGGKTGGQGG